MITVLRFIMLIVLFGYSCGLLAAIPHAYNHWGFMSIMEIDWQAYFAHFKWPALALGAAIIILSTRAGDVIIGLCLPTRKQALREQQKLDPALERLRAVYQDKFGLAMSPKAYVMDLPDINGLAFGRKTIAVSSGLLKTAHDEEIAGVLAHEIGHLHHRDSFFSVAIMAAAYPVYILSILMGAFFFFTWGIGLVALLCFAPIFAALCLGGWLLIGLDMLLEKVIRWPLEYKADLFAAEMGYAPALISLFERIEDEDVRGQEGFLAKYAYSHPPTALRIDRLERYLLRQSQSAA